jgi:hypothetical protein
MNLTSKRMLIGLAACVSACALTASAVQTWVSDSFEEASNGDAINTYQAEPYYGGTYTNYLWESMDGDASKIVTTEGQGYEGIRPGITNDNVTTSLHLNLETEGTTLIRHLGLGAIVDDYEKRNPISVGFSTDTNLYVDTLIKFTPSEDDPEINDSTVKVAVFVNASSNLVVYHKSGNSELFDTWLTNTVFESGSGPVIDPDLWYRLTIRIGVPSGIGAAACQIFLDNIPLSHANGYTDKSGETPSFEAGGNWFILAVEGATSISNVSFQGTGAIDEFVVADAAPGIPSPAGVLLTLSFTDTLVQVYDQTGNKAVLNGGTVPTGNEIRIETKADWYEIYSVTGAGTGSFTGTPTPGVLVTATTGTVSATASDTLTIATRKFSGGTISTGLGAGLPADKVAAWATTGQTLGVNDLTADMYDDYLLNVPAGTNAKISITSVEVSGTTVTIKVAVDKAAVDLSTLDGSVNGTLKVVSSDTLPVSGAATYIPFTTADRVATIVIQNSGKFIKARVE